MKPLIQGQWMKNDRGEVTRVVWLFEQLRQGRVALATELHETLSRDKSNMRLVFTATLSVDVPAHDDDLRAAFIELVTTRVREIYTPAVMLSKGQPDFKLSLSSREGKVQLPVFQSDEEAYSGE